MASSHKPLVLGLGHKARHGKDTAAAMIKKERGDDLKIVSINFADALRTYVNEDINSLAAGSKDPAVIQTCYKVYCKLWGVDYDPNAVVDATYVHGKQRALLQAIGQGKRDVLPDYWIDLWREAVEATDADVVLVTDMRYPNEARLIKELNGYTLKITRAGYKGLSPEAAGHISENALNDFVFDYNVFVREGQLGVLRRFVLEIFDSILVMRRQTLEI
jgi:hypothetical protein